MVGRGLVRDADGEARDGAETAGPEPVEVDGRPASSVSLRSGTIADGRGSFRLTVPAETDVRWLVDQLGAALDGVDLVGRRDRPRSAPADRLEDLFATLTDRQQEALRTAYHAGYFATPREASGSDVAELLDVTQPTFNEHLRNAERHVYEELLGS